MRANRAKTATTYITETLCHGRAGMGTRPRTMSIALLVSVGVDHLQPITLSDCGIFHIMYDAFLSGKYL